jgi:arginine decarboxylase
VVIVSPTYSGALSNIKEIADLCHSFDLPLIVDEAHGAHLLMPETIGQSALHSGADLVVHSMHKVLGGLTQTGIVHLSEQAIKRFALNENDLRAALNLTQSSSPSYIFLESIDELISSLESPTELEQIAQLERLGAGLRQRLAALKNIKIYQPAGGYSASHLLVGGLNPQLIKDFLIMRGIYPESILGFGLLLLLGTGSNESDVHLVVNSLTELDKSLNNGCNILAADYIQARPEPIEQVLSPRAAFFAMACDMPVIEAIGSIAAQCLAPCPPGWPVLVPGQRITADCLQHIKDQSIRVVSEPKMINTGEMSAVSLKEFVSG